MICRFLWLHLKLGLPWIIDFHRVFPLTIHSGVCPWLGKRPYSTLQSWPEIQNEALIVAGSFRFVSKWTLLKSKSRSELQWVWQWTRVYLFRIDNGWHYLKRLYKHYKPHRWWVHVGKWTLWWNQYRNPSTRKPGVRSIFTSTESTIGQQKKDIQLKLSDSFIINPR